MYVSTILKASAAASAPPVPASSAKPLCNAYTDKYTPHHCSKSAVVTTPVAVRHFV